MRGLASTCEDLFSALASIRREIGPSTFALAPEERVDGPLYGPANLRNPGD